MTEATILNREEKKSRQRRRDRGSYQVTGRDVELLGLIGEQYTVTLEQLARLIGRSYRTARGLRDRWANAGWVESARLTVDRPPFVWLTGSGSRIAQSPYRTWAAHAALAAHIEAVTEVRMLLDRRLRLGEWECERAIAQRSASRSQDRPHLPDAVLDPQRIAIEVELTLKSRARLIEIVTELSSVYPQVWYFAPARLHTTLTEIAKEMPYRNISVHHFPPLIGDLYRQHPDLDLL